MFVPHKLSASKNDKKEFHDMYSEIGILIEEVKKTCNILFIVDGLKGTLLHLRQFLNTETPLNVMENVFISP